MNKKVLFIIIAVHVVIISFLSSSCALKRTIEVNGLEKNIIDLDMARTNVPGNKIRVLTIKNKMTEPRGIFLIFKARNGRFNMRVSGGDVKFEHKEPFLTNFMGGLARENFFVVAPDLGPISDPKKSITAAFRGSEEAIDDLKALVEHLRKDNPGLPIWALGERVGGFSAIHCALNTKVDGLILITPAIGVKGMFHVYNPGYPYGFLNLDLEKIEVPTTIIYHTKNVYRNGTAARKIKDRLTCPTTLIEFSSGNEQGPFKFNGIEDELIKEMVSVLEI